MLQPPINSRILRSSASSAKGLIMISANRLRGPYRPPQFRLVMLPLVVLRRLDCVLEPTKDAVLAQHKKLQAQNLPQEAMDRTLSRAADPKRKQPLYNISPSPSNAGRL